MNNKLKRKSFFFSSKNTEKTYEGDDNDDDDDNDDGDEEDLETLRLAALQSLQYKKALRKDLSISSLNVKLNHCRYPCCHVSCKNSNHSTVYNNKFSQQINKNSLYHFQQKSNLIEIVPKDVNIIVMNRESQRKLNSSDTSEHFDFKTLNDISKPKSTNIILQKAYSVLKSESARKEFNDIQKKCSDNEKKIEKNIDDDDDIILMSDHEEEDSLERLMDEMEKEITPSPDKKRLRNCSTSVITSTEQLFTNLEGHNNNSHRLKKVSYSKYKSLSPKSALHVASQESSKKLIIKPQYNLSKRNSSSILLHSKLERSLRISRTDSEPTAPRSSNILDLNSLKSKARTKLRSSASKSLLHKNDTSFITQKLTSENLSSKLMTRNNSYRSSNYVLPENSCTTDYLEQSNSIRSKKLSISFNAINAHVCCHNYSMICCKRSTCILNKRFKKKENYNNKNNCLTNTQILEARRRKFESVKPIDFIDSNKKIRISYEANKMPTITSSKANLNIIDTKVNEQNSQEIFNCGTNFFHASNKINNYPIKFNYIKKEKIDRSSEISERKISKKKRRRKESELYKITKIKNEIYKKKRHSIFELGENIRCNSNIVNIDNKGDLRTELSRRRAERLNKLIPMQSARLLQSAFKEVVNEYGYRKKFEDK